MAHFILERLFNIRVQLKIKILDIRGLNYVSIKNKKTHPFTKDKSPNFCILEARMIINCVRYLVSIAETAGRTSYNKTGYYYTIYQHSSILRSRSWAHAHP